MHELLEAHYFLYEGLDMLLYEHSSFIDELLGSNTHYRVPFYQRRYVWNEMNWDTLWKDILFQLKVKEQQKEEDHPMHFMGPIVTRSIGKKAYEVIDGQQRLATFQIILCVIRDLCKIQDDSQIQKLASSAAKYIVNDEDVLIDDPDYEFTFIPTEYDQSAFSRVTSGEYVQNSTNSDEHSILKAYNHFADLIREYVGDNLNFEKMRQLLRSITDRFSFIHINLRSEDEHPAKVFASINATGRKLSEFDYLRNDLFLRAENKAESFYTNYWDFEKDPDCWQDHSLDSFFRAFLMAKQGPDCFEKNVQPFEVYQQYREGLTTEQGIKYEFQELSNWAKSYQSLQQNNPDYLSYVSFGKDLRLPDLDSFLLFVKHTSYWSLREIRKILESYIVRRMLVLENSTCSHTKIKEESYDNIISFFYTKVREKQKFDKNPFVAFLRDNRWPDDNAVRDAFEQVDSKNADFIEYVFRKIEEWKKKKDSVAEQESIIHELPPINYGDRVDLLKRSDNYSPDIPNIFILLWPFPSF